MVFDPRVPTWDGLRVGMTGAELARHVEYTEIECRRDHTFWPGRMLCALREASHPECDDPDANGPLVVFDLDVAKLAKNEVSAAEARHVLRDRRIVAIDLGPGCGE
ncbi:MAG: hypothetical protein SFX73_23135 [Kofleriaceae bacterium]|nr:hypothetical protein [Kofleriaceae bacterium]